MFRILFWFRDNSPDSAILWTHAVAIGFLAYLPWLAQATHGDTCHLYLRRSETGFTFT